MAILKVARLGHPVLRTKAEPVPVPEIGSARIQQLIDDLFETMREYQGIGLAAPQVHVSSRIFVAGLRPSLPLSEGQGASSAVVMDDDHDMPLIVLVNPELSLLPGGAEEAWEGCLSVPDLRGRVPRASAVSVRAYDRHGKRIEITAKGLPARVIQHEYDHLDGILFFDRMPTLATLTFMDEYQRFWAKSADHEEDDE
jgi:peptide deformylase